MLRHKIELQMSFGPIKVTHPTYLYDKAPYPIVLGSDFMKKQETIIDYAAKHLKIRGETIRFHDEVTQTPEMASLSRMFTSQNHFHPKSRSDDTSHLCFDWSDSIAEPGQRTKLQELLKTFADTFARSDFDVGCYPDYEFKIETGDQPPVQERPYRLPFHKREIVRRLIQDLLDQGIIQPSESDWASPIVLVEKKDHSWRLCVNFQKLNHITRLDRFPMPLARDLFDTFGGAKFFSRLDMASGFHQLKIHPDSRHKTSFVCICGSFQWLKLPFGLCNAPAAFSRAMQKVLAPLGTSFVLNFMDDIVIFSKTFHEHLDHIRTVLSRLRQVNMKLKPKKCEFCKSKLEFLGYVVSKEGMGPSTAKVEKLLQLSKTLKHSNNLRGFLGPCIILSHTDQRLQQASSYPLTQLTKKDNNDGKTFRME